ncbi:MAG: hypothetical protein LBL61_00220 [Elusimicrobiota bacterium]|jgi:Ni/Co efflux regulator RcnB|nr:hypothetical protein [Elusimicrobiota bacterium]
MRKIILILVVFAVCLANVAYAQRAVSSEDIKKVVAIRMRVLDISARYWARRIMITKDTTVAQLDDNSQDASEEETVYNEKFIRQIKENIKNGNYAPLTKEEEEKLNDARLEIRSIVMPGTADKALQAELTDEYCLNLDARYWAWRVVVDDDTTVEELYKNWGKSTPRNKKIIGLIKENIKNKNTKPLSETELYTKDACIAKYK